MTRHQQSFEAFAEKVAEELGDGLIGLRLFGSVDRCSLTSAPVGSRGAVNLHQWLKDWFPFLSMGTAGSDISDG